jgi:diaminopimelate epimerase
VGLHFYKYQGTGNDFIIIDNRKNSFKYDAIEISGLCDRNFGIGADGLILLEDSRDYDFSMKYFNSDGLEVEMCGNGGRCIIAFALHLGIISQDCTFQAKDGVHTGGIIKQAGNSTDVWISLGDVNDILVDSDHYQVNTGVPHFIRFVEDTSIVDVVGEGRKIRYNKNFKESGINVDFCHLDNGKLSVRTYERGVENETLSCGTGVTAASIAAVHKGLVSPPVRVATRGGDLQVDFNMASGSFFNIKLSGKAMLVFRGVIPNLEESKY